MDSYVFRCWGCGAWRLPEQYMNKPHNCGMTGEGEHDGNEDAGGPRRAAGARR
ncbi:hypothetical protein VG1_CDS0042 [Arthrobacter phage Cupello]|nr:hypothetical protein VG1_CDS0042 [Arthrobacter phage Cupello]